MRKLVLMIILSCVSGHVFSEEIESYQEKIAKEKEFEDEEEYAPYTVEEFSPALHQLRRGEVLFFGSLPITYLYSNLGYMAYTQMSGTILDGDDKNFALLYSSISLSFAVVVVDAVLGLKKK